MKVNKLNDDELNNLSNDELKEIIKFTYNELSHSAEYYQNIWLNSNRTISAARGYANACYKTVRKIEIHIKKKNE